MTIFTGIETGGSRPAGRFASSAFAWHDAPVAIAKRVSQKRSLTKPTSKACGAWSHSSCKTLIVRKGPRNVGAPCWAQGISEDGFSEWVLARGFSFAQHWRREMQDGHQDQ